MISFHEPCAHIVSCRVRSKTAPWGTASRCSPFILAARPCARRINEARALPIGAERAGIPRRPQHVTLEDVRALVIERHAQPGHESVADRTHCQRIHRIDDSGARVQHVLDVGLEYKAICDVVGVSRLKDGLVVA